MPAVLPDRYDFEFSKKASERKHLTEDSIHIPEIWIIDNRKLPESFQSCLGNSNNRTNQAKYLFQRWRKTLSKVLTSQTIYLANLDVATDRVKSQRSERIDFYCDHEKADTNTFRNIKFLCDNIRLNRVIIISPDTDVAVIFLHQSVTSRIILDAIWFKIGTGDNHRYIIYRY